MLRSLHILGLLHWNPHWQCFEQSPACSAGATKALTKLLNPATLDFANVIEFETTTFTPPAGWASIGAFQSCGHDWDTLFYNTDRWSLVDNATGCLTPSRSFAAGTFQLKTDPEVEVVIFGAHFPQTPSERCDSLDLTEGCVDSYEL